MWSLFHLAYQLWTDPKTKREQYQLSVEGMMLVLKVTEDPANMALFREIVALARVRNRTYNYGEE